MYVKKKSKKTVHHLQLDFTETPEMLLWLQWDKHFTSLCPCSSRGICDTKGGDNNDTSLNVKVKSPSFVTEYKPASIVEETNMKKLIHHVRKQQGVPALRMLIYQEPKHTVANTKNYIMACSARDLNMDKGTNRIKLVQLNINVCSRRSMMELIRYIIRRSADTVCLSKLNVKEDSPNLILDN